VLTDLEMLGGPTTIIQICHVDVVCQALTLHYFTWHHKCGDEDIWVSSGVLSHTVGHYNHKLTCGLKFFCHAHDSGDKYYTLAHQYWQTPTVGFPHLASLLM
jgi:hypothetical protein